MILTRPLQAVVVALNLLTSLAHHNETRSATQLIENQDLTHPYPYEFPLLQNGSMAESGQFPMPKCRGFKLEEATIDQLQDALSRGRLTSVQIVMCYLQRIYQTDEYIQYVLLNHQKLPTNYPRSVMEINPDFLEIAMALDTERSRGNIRGPLHGIPFIVKDNIVSKE